jgi:hypothetical protein
MTRFLHSSSAQKYFDVCPQQFWLYETGAPKGESPEHFRFGIAAHLVMQMYVDHCVAKARRTDVTVIGDFIDAAVRKSGLSLARYDELTQVIRGFLAVYEIDVEHSLEREGGIAFDEELRVIPWSEEYDYERMRRPMDHAAAGVMMRLRLDHSLLFPEESRLVVQDYKSDIFPPSQSAIDDPSSRFNQQARKYAWAAWRALYPAEVVEVHFPFMRYTAYGRALTRRLVFTKDDILQIEEQELAKVRFIEQTSDFPARPGDHCANCAFRDTACPVPFEAVTDEPASVARRFLYERVQQEQRRERIRDFVGLYGWTGELGALRSGFEQDEAAVADMERVWRILEDVGFDRPWVVMSLSKTDAKALLDKDVFERVLKEAYDPEIAVRFNLHQRKDVLQQLAIERGIPTQVTGKKGMKDKTVAELAYDLANADAVAGGSHRELPKPTALEPFGVAEVRATSVDLDTLEEIH